MEITTEEKIKIIMQREGVSVQDLANRLKVSRQSVNQKINRGFAEDLKKYADALGYDYAIEFKKKTAEPREISGTPGQDQ